MTTSGILGDPRIQKTRAALIDALMALITEKPWHQIAVAEICRRARVHRATFYVHFEDKNDLYERGLAMVFDGLVETGKAAPGQPAMEQQFAVLLRHGTAHRAFYLSALAQGGRVRALFIDYLVAHALAYGKHKGTPQSEAQELHAHLGAGAIVGTLEWYLSNSPAMAIEEAAALLARGIRQGIPV